MVFGRTRACVADVSVKTDEAKRRNLGSRPSDRIVADVGQPISTVRTARPPSAIVALEYCNCSGTKHLKGSTFPAPLFLSFTHIASPWLSRLVNR